VTSVSLERSMRPRRESWLLSLYFHSSSNKNFILVENSVYLDSLEILLCCQWCENEYVLQVPDRPLHKVKSTPLSTVCFV
jgi:hypothetical protein